MKKGLIIGGIVILVLVFVAMWGSDADEYIAEDSAAYGGAEHYDYSDNYNNAYQSYTYETNTGSNSNWLGFGSLGSATDIAGTTLVVSIFANDVNTSWTENDNSLMYESKDYLKIACDWLSENIAKFGTNSTFVYDWYENQDLYYTANINADMVNNIDDYSCWEYIDQNIDSAALMSKYNANNIVYLMYFNTPFSNETTSCTRNYYEGMEYPYEICYMYMGLYGEKENPSAFAHEMLHTFGAPDFYRTDDYGDNYGVTQEFVQYFKDSNSNDVMYTNYDVKTGKSHFDRITNEFTELDAYYIGIVDHSDIASEWGLQPSQY